MKSYVKKYGLWISLFFIIMAVTVLIMALNKVPSLEIKYAVFLMAFLFSVVVVIEFLKYQKDVRYLKALEGEISISLENLPKPKDDMEQGYQRLLLSLMEEKVRIQNVQEARTRDFTEYLTMWIHQVKTPISALHLLFGEKEQFIDLSEEQEELFLMEQIVFDGTICGDGTAVYTAGFRDYRFCDCTDSIRSGDPGSCSQICQDFYQKKDPAGI